MMEGWKQLKIKDFCEFKYGKNLPQNKRIPGQYPVYGSSNLAGTHNKFLVEGPGIIIGRKGTVGRVQFSKDNFFPIDTTYYVAEDKSQVDLKFLYYRLPLCGFEEMNSDAAVPGLNRSAAISQKINLPPLTTQRKIASILSAYDDLIENNLKRIKLLQEKAHLTYEEWFSVKGTPNGWNEYKLGELIDFHIGGGWGEEFQTDGFPDPAYVIRGTDMDNLPLGSIENVPNRWQKVSNLKSRRLKHGDIVFEVSGGSSYEGVAKTLLITEGLLNQFDGDVMCASFCKLMRPKSVSYSYALILFLKYLRKTKSTEIFEKRSASNIVNYNWEAFLKFQSVKMPNDELLKEFNDIVESMISSIYNLGNQITKLKEARDILLPRLMTGMIDVDKMNIETLQPTTA
jgi:type I restriction enzyme S subunit